MSEPKIRDSRACPECGAASLHRTSTASAGLYGPALLPGLGGFLTTPQFHLVVCADCGLTRFYADSNARAKLRTVNRRQRL
jgi:predicted nucleic-acid-binding Zn-ribbon protein